MPKSEKMLDIQKTEKILRAMDSGKPRKLLRKVFQGSEQR
jgi:hypothetical protein